jgi:hypothetical protein
MDTGLSIRLLGTPSARQSQRSFRWLNAQLQAVSEQLQESDRQLAARRDERARTAQKHDDAQALQAHRSR